MLRSVEISVGGKILGFSITPSAATPKALHTESGQRAFRGTAEVQMPGSVRATPSAHLELTR